MTGVVLWGATGQMRMLVELMAGTGSSLVALVDSVVSESPVPGIPLFADADGLRHWLGQNKDIARAGYAAIGGNRGGERRRIQQCLMDLGLSAPALVHRTAYVAHGVTLGSGSQLLPHARVCAAASIGRSVIVNTGASVDHDCVIGDGAHIGPGAILAGEVVVGTDVFIGSGAVILPRTVIADNAVIGAGAVVLKSVSSGQVVVGNPARVMSAKT